MVLEKGPNVVCIYITGSQYQDITKGQCPNMTNACCVNTIHEKEGSISVLGNPQPGKHLMYGYTTTEFP